MLIDNDESNESVIDEGNTWVPSSTFEHVIDVREDTYSEEAANQFITLILQDYEDIPNSNGMKVLRKVLSLESRRGVYDVVLRNITEPFWNEVITATDREYRIAAENLALLSKGNYKEWKIYCIAIEKPPRDYDDYNFWRYEDRQNR